MDIPSDARFVEASEGFFTAPRMGIKMAEFWGFRPEAREAYIASMRGERPITMSRCTLTPIRIPKPMRSVSIEVPP